MSANTFLNLSIHDRECALMHPILQALQEAGGELTRQEIREHIIAADDQIAAFAKRRDISKRTGNSYSKFNFTFNFALKNLLLAGLLTYRRGDPTISLTTKGQNLDLNHFDSDRDVYAISNQYWQQQTNHKNRPKTTPTLSDATDLSDREDQLHNEFSAQLLDVIAKMTPRKFEIFSRRLLSKMGIEFKSQGVQVSNDGGIDGYGYHRDPNDFRTTRVVIQCKRYNSGDVGSPEIDRFLGAMNKFQADYGIFITNSRYSSSAQKAALAGTPITLLDGNDLVRLVIKYQLDIKPVTTYELLDFYDNSEA